MALWPAEVGGVAHLKVIFIFFLEVLLKFVLGGILMLLGWREGFRGAPLLDIAGSLQLLNSLHVRERDKALLRSVMVGGVWNGFLLSRVRGQPVPCRFCGAVDGDGHLFWECTFPLSLRFVKILSFMIS